MKHLFLSCLLFGFILACDDDPEPFTPVCTDFTLEKVDWTYCDPVTTKKCFNENDTLTWKTIFFYEDEVGSITYTPSSGYCVTKTSGLSFTAFNLPSCFQKEGLKVRFSGFTKENRVDYACGSPFELTAIEEIPNK